MYYRLLPSNPTITHCLSQLSKNTLPVTLYCWYNVLWHSKVLTCLSFRSESCLLRTSHPGLPLDLPFSLM